MTAIQRLPSHRIKGSVGIEMVCEITNRSVGGKGPIAAEQNMIGLGERQQTWNCGPRSRSSTNWADAGSTT